MTIQQAYQQLLVQLYEIYENREAANIADMLIENVTGFKKIDRIINKSFPLTTLQENQLKDYSNQLQQHRPVQYVLNEVWFAGMKLYVDENVLIPRPETEELVEWVVQEVRSEEEIWDLGFGISDLNKTKLSIIDIGTGSGCIPIAIKKKVLNADITAIDVSTSALEVARRNATEQNVSLNFIQLNFLNEDEWNRLESFDRIVSNPPYIKQSEEALMHQNVLKHEPHVALFVPDEDALIFYRKIALFATKHLNESGIIFLEINEALATEVATLFNLYGYNIVEIKKDMQGKDRMVRVKKSWYKNSRY